MLTAPLICGDPTRAGMARAVARKPRPVPRTMPRPLIPPVVPDDDHKSPLKRSPICDRLRDTILRGELPAGSQLRQQELADRFDVAQGVIREALLELSHQGLVEMIERRGMFVATSDPAALADALEVRELHEAMAVRRCCERVTRTDIRALTELAERIHRAARDGDSHAAASLAWRFHGRLFDLSGNATLARLAGDYRLWGLLAVARDPQAVRDEHLGLLAAIQDGRADDADLLARAHVAAARRAIQHERHDEH